MYAAKNKVINMKQLHSIIEKMTIAEIERVAFRDALTGCLNRHALDTLKPSGDVTIIDLDNLKYVNDQLGHEFGDKFISKTAENLVDVFGAENVYRLGGDEFLVFGADLDKLRDLCAKTGTFSYGAGRNLTDADKHLNEHKSTRLANGLRSKRDEKPKWIADRRQWRGTKGDN